MASLRYDGWHHKHPDSSISGYSDTPAPKRKALGDARLPSSSKVSRQHQPLSPPPPAQSRPISPLHSAWILRLIPSQSHGAEQPRDDVGRNRLPGSCSSKPLKHSESPEHVSKRVRVFDPGHGNGCQTESSSALHVGYALRQRESLRESHPDCHGRLIIASDEPEDQPSPHISPKVLPTVKSLLPSLQTSKKGQESFYFKAECKTAGSSNGIVRMAELKQYSSLAPDRRSGQIFGNNAETSVVNAGPGADFGRPELAHLSTDYFTKTFQPFCAMDVHKESDRFSRGDAYRGCADFQPFCAMDVHKESDRFSRGDAYRGCADLLERSSSAGVTKNFKANKLRTSPHAGNPCSSESLTYLDNSKAYRRTGLFWANASQMFPNQLVGRDEFNVALDRQENLRALDATNWCGKLVDEQSASSIAGGGVSFKGEGKPEVGAAAWQNSFRQSTSSSQGSQQALQEEQLSAFDSFSFKNGNLKSNRVPSAESVPVECQFPPTRTHGENLNFGSCSGTDCYMHEASPYLNQKQSILAYQRIRGDTRYYHREPYEELDSLSGNYLSRSKSNGQFAGFSKHRSFGELPGDLKHGDIQKYHSDVGDVEFSQQVQEKLTPFSGVPFLVKSDTPFLSKSDAVLGGWTKDGQSLHNYVSREKPTCLNAAPYSELKFFAESNVYMERLSSSAPYMTGNLEKPGCSIKPLPEDDNENKFDSLHGIAADSPKGQAVRIAGKPEGSKNKPLKTTVMSILGKRGCEEGKENVQTYLISRKEMKSVAGKEKNAFKPEMWLHRWCSVTSTRKSVGLDSVKRGWDISSKDKDTTIEQKSLASYNRDRLQPVRNQTETGVRKREVSEKCGLEKLDIRLAKGSCREDRDGLQCKASKVLPVLELEATKKRLHGLGTESHFLRRFFTPSAAAFAVIGTTVRQVHATQPEYKGLLGVWATLNDSTVRSRLPQIEFYKDFDKTFKSNKEAEEESCKDKTTLVFVQE